KENRRSEYGHRDSLQQIGRNVIERRDRTRRLVNENRFQHAQIVIEREKAAKERQRNQPEQAMISTGAQRSAEQIKLSKKSGQGRYACQRKHENSHAPG